MNKNVFTLIAERIETWYDVTIFFQRAYLPRFPNQQEGGNLYSIVSTAIVFGIQSVFVQVEADVCDGMPAFEMVGALSSEVKEAKERVKAAFRNSKIQLAPKRITVNFYPADIRKTGTSFDLPIALAVLSAYGRVSKECLKGIIFAGEVSLNGEIRPTTGILPMALAAQEVGKHTICVPRENMKEARVVKGMVVLPADNLNQVIAMIEEFSHMPEKYQADAKRNQTAQKAEHAVEWDFAGIHGQKVLKRVCEVAASGRHHMLMIGAPGAGKTMAARAAATILPDLTEEEALELAKIYSVSGRFEQREERFWERPFRNPHHTISVAGLAGGGAVPKPGELSLAHKGILFLDELTEFKREVLETLRQPLEERMIRLVRSSGVYHYPADVMLIGAMNPCGCGAYPDHNKCTCSPAVIGRHWNKLSKPLLDRMDLTIEVKRLSLVDMVSTEPQETSEAVKKRVQDVQNLQRKRFAGSGIVSNSRIPVSQIKEFCPMEQEAEKLLQEYFERLEMSARSYYRTIRVARTIADMEHSKRICRRHMIESLRYRGMDRKTWEMI